MTSDPSLIVVEDVAGAPVRIGAVVTIIRDSPDATISQGLLGCTGVVVALVYDDPGQQYPGNPLIQVRVQGRGEDLFFTSELALQPVRASSCQRVSRPRRMVRETRITGTADAG